MNRPFGANLSAADLDVLRLTAAGAAHKETASRLDMTEGAVRNHLSRVIRRLSAASTLHAVALMDDYRPGWRPRLPFPVPA